MRSLGSPQHSYVLYSKGSLLRRFLPALERFSAWFIERLTAWLIERVLPGLFRGFYLVYWEAFCIVYWEASCLVGFTSSFPLHSSDLWSSSGSPRTSQLRCDREISMLSMTPDSPFYSINRCLLIWIGLYFCLVGVTRTKIQHSSDSWSSSCSPWAYISQLRWVW